MPYSNVVAPPMKWFGVNRSELPAILEGRISPPGTMQNRPSTEVSVGVIMQDDERPILTLLVAEDQRLPDLLAWISTFAPEVFPLSQSVRILSQSDFSGVENDLSQARPHRRDIIWPSVIIGEMLAQGEPAPNLQTLPISRASASFSFCQARTSLIYQFNSRVRKITTSRLQQLQRERSFTQRVVNVDEMSAIWSFVDEHSSCTAFQREWVRSVVGVVEVGSNPNVNSTALLDRMGLNPEKLANGTIEGRVLEFEKTISEMLAAVATNVELRSNIPLVIASLCFLVGGGTSHISLLDEFAGEFPMVYAWFGLLAGLAGPRTWDAQWARIGTSVERLLRSGFSIYDPPSADICWAEYEWIASQTQSLPWLKELPKLYPRLVSVEVVPGANCQFRLGDSDEERQVHESRPATNRRVSKTPTPLVGDDRFNSLEIKLTDALREVQALRSNSLHGFTQNDFFQNSELGELTKSKPTRKRSTKK